MSIELKKKHVFELKQKAHFAIGMKSLSSIKAQVVLVLDISKSMNKLYKSGVVQNVIERILGLALNLDDDGRIDMMLFGTIAKLYQWLRLPVLEGLAVLGLDISQAYK